MQHYKMQIIKDIYKLLFSIEILGNPVGIFQSIGEGMDEFIEQTEKGLNNNNVCISMVNGGRLLLSSSFSGLFGSFYHIGSKN